MQPTKHQFCPEGLHNSVIAMVELHYSAHPDIPGMARPDATGMLWVYLWGNWSTRCELWARYSGADIPRLKTKMIYESQYALFSSISCCTFVFCIGGPMDGEIMKGCVRTSRPYRYGAEMRTSARDTERI
jgi:hypothetical protein